MDFEQSIAGLFQGVDPATPLAFGLVMFAGLIMGLAPSSLPLMGVVVGFASGEPSPGDRSRGFRLALGFVLGLASVDSAIGGLFGALGFVVIAFLARYLALTNLLIALMLLLLGLALLRAIRIRIPVLRPMLRRAETPVGAYALGIPFGLSTCPACTPVLLLVLAAAATTGSPVLGAALLFTFGLARGFPLLVAGMALGAARRVESMAHWVPVVERIAGILLLGGALYFLLRSAEFAGWLSPGSVPG
jgi:cytochrome c-type biogenesis protein